MATERETKTLKTTGGHEVVYKSYLTGREFNEIQAVLIKDVKFNAVGKDAQISGFDPSAIEASNKRMLEIAIVSVDGNTQNCADAILDLPYTETQEVMEVLDELSGKKKVSTE